MIGGEVAVAGVPSARLTQLAAHQLVKRLRRPGVFEAEHSAMRDRISDILHPSVTINGCRNSDNTATVETSRGYAGKSTCKINEALFTHGSKKHSPETNVSRQIATILCSGGAGAVTKLRGTKTLKQYFSPEDMSEAFCAKFHVTDPLTGRTEIMTARRPGRASAEVNVADFDAYMLRRVRPSSIKKAKDNIDHDILGLMPKPNMEIKSEYSHVRPLISGFHIVPTIECKDNWMTPSDNAKVCKTLGLSKRRAPLPWLTGDSNAIVHHHKDLEGVPPDVARGCIQPLMISE